MDALRAILPGEGKPLTSGRKERIIQGLREIQAGLSDYVVAALQKREEETKVALAEKTAMGKRREKKA